MLVRARNSPGLISNVWALMHETFVPLGVYDTDVECPLEKNTKFCDEVEYLFMSCFA